MIRIAIQFSDEITSYMATNNFSKN